MLRLERYLYDCGLETTLLDLVKLCPSQIDGCAYYGIDMHSEGCECPDDIGRAPAALAWTEAVMRITEGHVPDAVYGPCGCTSPPGSWRT